MFNFTYINDWKSNNLQTILHKFQRQNHKQEDSQSGTTVRTSELEPVKA